jgi:hypothetical protein
MVGARVENLAGKLAALMGKWWAVCLAGLKGRSLAVCLVR